MERDDCNRVPCEFLNWTCTGFGDDMARRLSEERKSRPPAPILLCCLLAGRRPKSYWISMISISDYITRHLGLLPLITEILQSFIGCEGMLLIYRYSAQGSN